MAMAERPILFSAPMICAILADLKSQTRRVLNPQPSAYVTPPPKHKPKRAHAYFDAYCGQRKTAENPRGMSDRWCWWTNDDRQGADWIRCPYGAPGDRLWVRETHAVFQVPGDCAAVAYRATCPDDPAFDYVHGDGSIMSLRVAKWTPAIHMPRWASRLTLEVTSVRAQRLHDISEDDARAEGVALPVEPVPEQPGKVQPLFQLTHAPLMEAGIRPSRRNMYRWAYSCLWEEINGKRAPWARNDWVWVIGFKRVEATQAGAAHG
jgi:hypothetical protein